MEVSFDKFFKGELSDEFIEFFDEFGSEGYIEFVVEDFELSRNFKEFGYNVIVEFLNIVGEKFCLSFEEFLGENWFDEYFSVGVVLIRFCI